MFKLGLGLDTQQTIFQLSIDLTRICVLVLVRNTILAEECTHVIHQIFSFIGIE